MSYSIEPYKITVTEILGAFEENVKFNWQFCPLNLATYFPVFTLVLTFIANKSILIELLKYSFFKLYGENFFLDSYANRLSTTTLIPVVSNRLFNTLKLIKESLFLESLEVNGRTGSEIID